MGVGHDKEPRPFVVALRDTAYTVIVEQRDGGSFRAIVPDLPGCIYDGPTIEDALSNVRGVIEQRLQSMREAARSSP